MRTALVVDTGRLENLCALPSYGLPYSNAPTTQHLEKLEELRVLTEKFSSPQDAHKILEWPTMMKTGDTASYHG